MSYEDTNCPCGDKKERETMLCAACMNAFKDHPAMTVFESIMPMEDRKHAALILLRLSRGRKRLARAVATLEQQQNKGEAQQ